MKDIKNLEKIKLFVIDVDGTMTDAGIYYDEHGNELKKFCTKDAVGYFAAHKVGMELMVLTGRECAATTRRMQEMKFDYILQNVKDKESFLTQFMEEHGLQKDEVGYIGDDLNDLPAMRLCGYIGCPADACEEIIEIADYVACKKGGEGAVRDVLVHLLKERGEWQAVFNEMYGAGI